MDRLIRHTERLLEDKEEKLCIQVLSTLRQMMNFDVNNGEKDDALRRNLVMCYFSRTSSNKKSGLAGGANHSTTDDYQGDGGTCFNNFSKYKKHSF